MCGIVGMCSNVLSQKEKLLFTDLLYVDTLRGQDSTGVLLVNKDLETLTLKQVGPASNLIQSDEYTSDIINPINSSLLLGHNRAATRGTVSIGNAHPFTVDHITLVHNGSLISHKRLSDKDHDVDSEAICYAIAKEGIKEASKKLDGSFSLVWYDAEKKTINFARNKDRPMHLALIAGSATLVWASEKSMLEWILERNGYNSQVEPTPILKHISFPILGPYKNFDSEDIEEFKYTVIYNDYKNRRAESHGFYSRDYHDLNKKAGEEIKFSVYGKTPYNYNGETNKGTVKGVVEEDGIPEYVEIAIYGADLDQFNYKDTYKGEIISFTSTYQNRDYQSPCLIIKESSVSKITDDPVNQPNSVVAMYRGPNHTFITGYKLSELLKGGCSVCHEEIKLKDSENIHWIDQHPVCRVCYHDPQGAMS